MDLAQYAELFRSETREHLSVFNQLLLDWERTPDNNEPVDGIFRAVHTVKGMAATMGYAKVADLAHRAENLLDVVRKGHATVSADILELLFRTADALEELVEASVAGQDAGMDLTGLLDRLDEATVREAPPEQRDRPRRRISFVNAPVAVGRKVEVTIRADSALKGARALIVLKRMDALGAVHGIEPAPAAIESETFDGRFAFRVETMVDAQEIEAAVRAAGDVERVTIDDDQGAAGAAATPGPGTAAAAPEPREAAGRTRHIRVDLQRLDTLMNLIGELVTARGRLAALSASSEDAALADVAVKVSQLTQALQAEIIQARMTPVWQVFDRFPRLVRDLSRQLGKQVGFRVEGKEIELDRAVLDEIGDPLVHLLRNAVDHGIEPPGERTAAGKPAEGRVVLSALRERATVAIRVEDDGRGIDREKILLEAKQRGVIDPEVDVLTDDLLVRVLSRAGFSTAREVSDVSGRGVGVDVVATRMRALGGSVEVKSEPGSGTSFTLRLPVTLAIVRALLVRVGDERYALPLTHVAETVELKPDAVTRVEGREALMLRDEELPPVDLRELLGTSAPAPTRRPVIVLQLGDRRAGLVVDAMTGQQEIVVKSFDPPRGTLPIFSGATILGDGAPVLILDAGGLV
ncbi:MAG TPA: chemotaxis protein CheA [Gemmatimonadales bacterium]|nr:chemotaxis protein CheA [Gemmatimonadales bacterium]